MMAESRGEGFFGSGCGGGKIQRKPAKSDVFFKLRLALGRGWINHTTEKNKTSKILGDVLFLLPEF